MDELTAISRARKLVGQITSAPIDVYALAGKHGMEVAERELAPGQAGNTLDLGTKIFIVVNQNDDPARKRFTVLHEMAHHLLELPSKHGEKVPSDELERFRGRPIEERLCDTFAAECLVPNHLLRPLVVEARFSIDVLHELCEHFQASRQCLASCFVRASREMLAYVYCEQGRIQHVITSAALRQAGIYIQEGMAPSGSAASLADANRSIFESAELDASDWSSSDAAISYSCYEEACHMPKHGATLSLLTFELAASQQTSGRTEALDEDPLLEELTGHLQFKKR
ncbi:MULTISPECIES: ImmA/IrrE family metallo-endopeptidase [unclassified Pseudoxanthomonas]|uniref:ImmA/IrrE family metallo-endopeptidase n=1 Tax=unclassified Pseudoxanthomonas TaxID=2645906 RepID=UPI0030777376